MNMDREEDIEVDIPLPDFTAFAEAMRQREEQRRVQALIYADYNGLDYHAIGWDQPHGPIGYDLLREPDWVAEVRLIAERAMTELTPAPEIQYPPRWKTPWLPTTPAR